MLERIFVPSCNTAAAVSSQEVSTPRVSIKRNLLSRRRIIVLQPEQTSGRRPVSGVQTDGLLIACFGTLKLTEGSVILATEGMNLCKPERLVTQPRLGNIQKIERLPITSEPVLRLGQIKISVWIGRIDDDGFFQPSERFGRIAALEKFFAFFGEMQRSGALWRDSGRNLREQRAVIGQRRPRWFRHRQAFVGIR